MKASLALSITTLAALSFALPRAASALPFHGRDLGLAPAAQSVSFIVKLPLRNRAELEELTTLQATPGSPIFGHFLTVAQFRERYGPTPETIRRAVQALASEGFRVAEVDSQSIRASGPASAVDAAFGVRMHMIAGSHGRMLPATTDAIRPQPALASLGATVIGLWHPGERRSHMRFAAPRNRTSKLGGYWFDDLKQAYQYVEYQDAAGAGVTIATVGVADFSQSDAERYFEHERLGSGGTYLAPQPKLLHTLMTGYTPFDPNGDGYSEEANLDVQQAGGSAPVATILGIATANTDQGFISAYTNIVEKKTGYVAQIVSTSYGQCELTYTAAYNGGTDYTSIITQSYHDEFVQGNSEGITFTTSSGDNAGLDCPQAGYFTNSNGGGKYVDVKGVEADADDPNVVAVGGTNLATTYTPPSLNSTYVAENSDADYYGSDDPYDTGNTVTNELWGSGGGASQIFAKPSYQNDLPTGFSTRAVPDVSMHMGGCPEGAQVCASADSSDALYYNGAIVYAIGTSAASPDFAGLLAIRLGHTKVALGNANAFIYNVAATNNTKVRYFHQGISGTNGVVYVAPRTLGWNQINGVGTPYGEIFVDAQEHPYAGLPQTATNP